MIDFFHQQEFLKRAARTCRMLSSSECASLSALLKRNTGRFRESDHTIRNRRFWNIALRHRCRVHICISKGNSRKMSCLGEHSTQGTSALWVNKQSNYRICI